MDTTNYCFREAKDKKELLSLLHLRYKIYREDSQVKGFCTENKFGIDLDNFDCYARHFGLFKVENGEDIPVGYMRVVQEEVSPTREQIRAIALSCSWEMLRKVEENRDVPFPAMTYFPEAININKVKQKDQIFCEGSRFVLDKNHRSLRLSRFMFECAMTFVFFIKKMDGAIVCCTKNHSRFYKKYGFQMVPNTELCSSIEAKCNSSSILMFLLSKNIPTEINSKLSLMNSGFTQFQLFNFHPNKLNNFRQIQKNQSSLRGEKIKAA